MSAITAAIAQPHIHCPSDNQNSKITGEQNQESPDPSVPQCLCASVPSPNNPLLADTLDLHDLLAAFHAPNLYELRRNLLTLGIPATESHIQEFLKSDTLKNTSPSASNN